MKRTRRRTRTTHSVDSLEQRTLLTSMFIHDSSNKLATIDVETGETEIIGDMGERITDIAFAPNGDLYGVSSDSFWKIDRTDASLTMISEHGIPGANALEFSRSGTLYAAGFTSESLFTIDPESGQSTDIGTTGFESSGDLAFHKGQLYLSAVDGQFVSIDLKDEAAGTLIAEFEFTEVFGLESVDGKLLGVDGNTLFEIAPRTGEVVAEQEFSAEGFEQAFGASFIRTSDVTVEVLEEDGRTIVEVTGGRAADSLSITDTSEGLAIGGENGTTINGSHDPYVMTEMPDELVVKLRRGHDRLTMSEANLGTVMLDVRTGRGRDTVTMQQSVHDGMLHLNNTGGHDQLIVSESAAGDIDFDGIGHLAIGNSSLRGDIAFHSGLRNSNDVLQILNSDIDGALEVRLGLGEDIVSLEGSNFANAVVIATGAHDDRLAIRTNLFEEDLRAHTRLGADTMIADANLVRGTFMASGGLSRSDSIAVEATGEENNSHRGFENEIETTSETALDALTAIDEALIDFGLV